MNKQDIQTVLDALKTSAHYSIGYSERREAAITICEAALAEPEGEPSTVLRLIDTIKYLVGIAERGEGRKARDDELPEQFVLGYVKRLEEAIAEPSEPFSKVLQSATNYDGTWSALVTAPCWLPTGLPLFTHPASKPAPLPELTDDDILRAITPLYSNEWLAKQAFDIAIDEYRAILAAAREKEK